MRHSSSISECTVDVCKVANNVRNFLGLDQTKTQMFAVEGFGVASSRVPMLSNRTTEQRFDAACVARSNIQLAKAAAFTDAITHYLKGPGMSMLVTTRFDSFTCR